MALLKVEDLYSGYGETEILHGVHAEIDQAEIVAVIGPNGAGKSTLIKTIIGMLTPTRGSIHFRGAEIAGRNPEELVTEGLAYVPQNRSIFPNLTVMENFEMAAITRRPGWLRTTGDSLRQTSLWQALAQRRRDGGDELPGVQPAFSEDEFGARVEHVASVFPNLRAKLRLPAGSLSGGEQQMVALGKSLILDPVLLLIDEPSAGLAPKLQGLIFDKILEINQHGTSIALVEQNAKKALAMAHRGYVLEMGRNRSEGAGQALLLDPEVGRLFLGG